MGDKAWKKGNHLTSQVAEPGSKGGLLDSKVSALRYDTLLPPLTTLSHFLIFCKEKKITPFWYQKTKGKKMKRYHN